MLNSVYDPLGFVAPILINGKILLREITTSVGWDETVDTSDVARWHAWIQSLQSLKEVRVPRMYFPDSLSLLHELEMYIFSDASEKAISAVAYLRIKEDSWRTSFVMGKAKLAPSHGHTIPRLELCAALLATQVAQIVQDNLCMRITKVQYFTDSRVVLGYLNNRTRRFYNYVSNRVERILHVSKPEQWHYVSTKENPADHGTRGLATGSELQEKWLCGPELLTRLKISETQVSYPLIQPEHDKEVRVEARKTTVDENFTVTFDYFSDWGKLINTISRIKMLARRHRSKPQHDMLDETEIRKESEMAIIKIMQKEVYKEDILSLRNGNNVTKDSPLRYLDPYIDESGLLRIGGRLRRGGLRIEQSNPLILPGKTHLTKLLIMSVHKQIHHQGRHITEGALRNRGYWIMGVKRVLNALIGNCVACRKLRRKIRVPEDGRST